tara:strand:+ start:51 stop:965 length:915 start_codon:yes stop_codon:yes gene_type:complete
MRDTFVASLMELAHQDKDIMFLTGDLGFGVFEEFENTFPNQYLNVGVAEQNMVGLASGLSLEGKKVFTYSIANFATLRCLEQIRNDAAYHNLNINIVASGGGFTYGQLGMSHHASEDLSIMRALPNVTSIAPCTAWEVGAATKALVKMEGVGYLRIEKQTSADCGGDKGPVFSIGKARRIREGTDFTIIATGGIFSEAIKAANKLEKHSIKCRVVSCHSLKPFDREEIIDAAKNTGGIITVEENNLIGGLGSAVAEVCLQAGVMPKKFRTIGLNDRYSAIVGDQEYLRAYYSIDSGSIMKSVMS